ncbi:hypothetical protein PPL_00884 [Heterostelium album PN500]|uniref:Uncharacterized protein n=1 Tax=Heterostelium pallidum (strain ATCC 26659 / Pp 5 / PN500) TaxID=670386 RepID=D3AYW5_HETP5|nr:hypothetical protein PPL_00884 [Heterostelium album PN500]EFA85655.1 hypothetical protein PPL_00884 [Heterostelium album PN500]|eukprot:XP_020437762.1 hypothetical protein PPL_00884 [Heterostelium album PN500]
MSLEEQLKILNQKIKNNDPIEEIENFLNNSNYSFYILNFRGISYEYENFKKLKIDKTEHMSIDETHSPMYSLYTKHRIEGKNLLDDFNNMTLSENSVDAKANTIREEITNNERLNSGYYHIEKGAEDKHYFSKLLYFLSQEYSRDYDAFDETMQKFQNDPSKGGVAAAGIPNMNFFVSTSMEPDHAIKYALGLKIYHSRERTNNPLPTISSMYSPATPVATPVTLGSSSKKTPKKGKNDETPKQPSSAQKLLDYKNYLKTKVESGKGEYPVGKLYIIKSSITDILKERPIVPCNLLKNGFIKLVTLIGSEREVSFISHIGSNRVIHQEVLTFDSYNLNDTEARVNTILRETTRKIEAFHYKWNLGSNKRHVRIYQSYDGGFCLNPETTPNHSSTTEQSRSLYHIDSTFRNLMGLIYGHYYSNNNNNNYNNNSNNNNNNNDMESKLLELFQKHYGSLATHSSTTDEKTITTTKTEIAPPVEPPVSTGSIVATRKTNIASCSISSRRYKCKSGSTTKHR